MKHAHIILSIIVIVMITASSASAQQGLALAKIRVDENGNVEILESQLNGTGQAELAELAGLGEPMIVLRPRSGQQASSDSSNLKKPAALPDLIPYSPMYSLSPPTWDHGYGLTVTVMVQNSGSVTAPPSIIGYYLSSDDHITTDDFLFGQDAVASIGPFLVSPVEEITYDLCNHPGTWYAGVYVDYPNAISEMNENNNTDHRMPAIQALPDLTYYGPEIKLTYTEPNITLEGEVHNQGNVPAASFKIGYYLSEDLWITTHDIFLGHDDYGILSINSLGFFEETFNISDKPGVWWAGFIIDYKNNVHEIDENDNWYCYSAYVNVTEPLPDLIVSNVEVQDGSGPEIQFTYSIQNQGDASTGSAFKNSIYLSDDQSITQSDHEIDKQSCGSLNPGMAYNSGICQITVNSVPAGDYYLGVYTDGDLEISESDENNNTKADNSPKVTIPMITLPLPDLIVSEVQVLDESGPDISCKVTVKNVGTATASGEFKNRIYLSADNIITSSDHLINDWNVTGTLAPDQSKTSNELTSTVSGVPAGSYYLGVIADVNKVILELNESNNTGFDSSPKVTISDGDSEDPEDPEEPEEPEEPAGNMIENWSFHDGMNDWEFATMGGGNATSSIESGVFHAQITNGGGELWEVRIYQDELNIVDGNIYTVSFRAKAASSRDIWATVGMGSEPFTTYNSDWIFSLTTDWQTYTYTFTMVYSTNTNALLTFNLGISSTDVYLDNISLVEEAEDPEEPEEPEEPAGNMISNWSFSNDLNGWQFNTSESGNAAGKVENGVLHAQITNGGVNVWNVALYKHNLNIINGNTYTVTFDARADSPRNILAAVAMGVSPFWLYNFEPTFSITTEWQTYTYTFTMGFDTDPAARMGFDLGASNADVYLDNISLVDITVTDIELEEPSKIVRTSDLFQNYPNPFNPTTTIGFQVPEPCLISLKIYNLLGKEMATLIHERKASGAYTAEWNAEDFPSGMYIYQLKAGTFTETRKLVLQK